MTVNKVINFITEAGMLITTFMDCIEYTHVILEYTHHKVTVNVIIKTSFEG